MNNAFLLLTERYLLPMINFCIFKMKFLRRDGYLILITSYV